MQKTFCFVLSIRGLATPWTYFLHSDGWHEQPLNEVVAALAPNSHVQFLSLLITVQVFTIQKTRSTRRTNAAREQGPCVRTLDNDGDSLNFMPPLFAFSYGDRHMARSPAVTGDCDHKHAPSDRPTACICLDRRPAPSGRKTNTPNKNTHRRPNTTMSPK